MSIQGAIDMAENTKTIKDPLDGQLPWDVIGAVEHHIRVLEVPMTNLREHPTEPIGIHTGRRKGAEKKMQRQSSKHLMCTSQRQMSKHPVCISQRRGDSS